MLLKLLTNLSHCYLLSLTTCESEPWATASGAIYTVVLRFFISSYLKSKYSSIIFEVDKRHC